MEHASLVAILSAGLGLGIVHAFDPDHLAAVGGMASGTSKRSKAWRYALHWSIGHGGILFFIAALVFILGAAIPQKLSHFAEQLVAYMLMFIGLWGFFKCWRRAEAEDELEVNSKSNQSGAWLVGVIHGTAGSAPLLTLIPLTQIQEPVVGLVYVLLFGVGVSLAMTGVGRLLTHFIGFFHRQSVYWRYLVQLSLAAFSFLFGLYLLISQL